MTSVVPFLSIASHTGCTKFMLHMCNNWLEKVNSVSEWVCVRERERERYVEIGD